MPSYTPPLRDMQFVMHELLHITDTLKTIPKHADMDAEHQPSMRYSKKAVNLLLKYCFHSTSVGTQKVANSMSKPMR